MSMTHVLLLRRVVQPGLFRISGNRESKGKEADTSSECCLFDDMHLPLLEGESSLRRLSQQACQRSQARRREKTYKSEVRSVTRLLETAEPPQWLHDFT